MNLTREKLQQALDSLKNDYDYAYFENKYGEGTHNKEFELLSNLKGDKVPNALGWIKNLYDCYYKDELGKGSAFDYLQSLIDELER